MIHQFLQVASTTHVEEKQDLFSSIGVDWKLLVLQSIAFLVLLVVLKRFVYPSIVKMLDTHEKTIAEAAEAANTAKDEAAKIQSETDAMLAKARKEAREIVATAKNEATTMTEEADKKAKLRAERMVETAREDIAKEVASAKKALHNETIDLIAEATGTVIGKAHAPKTDQAVIKEALAEASK